MTLNSEWMPSIKVILEGIDMKYKHLYRGYIKHHGNILDQFETTDELLAIAKVSRLLDEEYSHCKGTVVDVVTGNVVYQGRYSAIC